MNDPGTVLERWFIRLLPVGWSVQTMASRSGGHPTTVEVRAAGGAVRRLRVVVLSGAPEELHVLGRQPDRSDLVAVAPWLSPRACEALRDTNINYVDATGNVRLVLDEPAVFIQRAGALVEPETTDDAMLHRLKAVRFLRYLVDFGPKQRVGELAKATGLSTGYVSQLLKILEGKGLVRRGRRGRLEDIALDGLLLQYAESYEAEAFTESHPYASPHGAPALVEQLRVSREALVVSGSVAAAELVPLLGPPQLRLYSTEPPRVARTFGLTPARDGGDVVVLQPLDPFVTDNTWTAGGLVCASLPQVIADCFDNHESQAGEAVLRWALDHVLLWRAPEWQPEARPPVLRDVASTPGT